MSCSPSGKKGVLDIQIVKNFTNGLINDIINGFWEMIKRGHRRKMCAPKSAAKDISLRCPGGGVFPLQRVPACVFLLESHLLP